MPAARLVSRLRLRGSLQRKTQADTRENQNNQTGQSKVMVKGNKADIVGSNPSPGPKTTAGVVKWYGAAIRLTRDRITRKDPYCHWS